MSAEAQDYLPGGGVEAAEGTTVEPEVRARIDKDVSEALGAVGLRSDDVDKELTDEEQTFQNEMLAIQLAHARSVYIEAVYPKLFGDEEMGDAVRQFTPSEVTALLAKYEACLVHHGLVKPVIRPTSPPFVSDDNGKPAFEVVDEQGK